MLMYKKLEFNVRERDVNLNDLIRPATILDYFQDIAGMHADILGVGYKDMLNLNLYWVILYEEFEVINNLPKFGERILVNTWPKTTGRLEAEREYEIRDLNNNLLIKGISNWCVISTDTRKLERMDKVKFNGEYYDKSNYLEKSKRRLNLKLKDVIKEYNYKVLLTDLDHNKHLNNARYLDIIYNMREDLAYKNVKKVEIAFLHEVRYDEIINVKYFKDEFNVDSYIGYVNDTECFEARVIMED